VLGLVALLGGAGFVSLDGGGVVVVAFVGGVGWVALGAGGVGVGVG